jgi:hypothetical protein
MFTNDGFYFVARANFSGSPTLGRYEIRSFAFDVPTPDIVRTRIMSSVTFVIGHRAGHLPPAYKIPPRDAIPPVRWLSPISLDVIDMRKNARESQSPPIIYLPSSGGLGGSRLAPEVSDLKVQRSLATSLTRCYQAHHQQEIPISPL